MEYEIVRERAEFPEDCGYNPEGARLIIYEQVSYYVICPLCACRTYATGDTAEFYEDGSPTDSKLDFILTTEEGIQESIQQGLEDHYLFECPCYLEYLDE